MDIIISNNSDRPIYEQIEEQMKALIVSGELKEGEALPSMRLLAKELRISIITTKRAYEDLERDGYIESYTGKGSFVKAINHERVREAALCEIEELLESAISKANLAGISLLELRDRLQLLYEASPRPDTDSSPGADSLLGTPSLGAGLSIDTDSSLGANSSEKRSKCI